MDGSVVTSSGSGSSASRLDSMWVALGVFVGNRVLLLLLTFLAGRLLSDTLGRNRTLGGLWQQWDVLWYLRIADHGYSWRPPPAQSDLAFFPLYPLTIHLLTVLTPLSAYAAGLLIACLAFAVALYLLHRLVALDFSSEVAQRTVTYLSFFPTALFFFAAYSEALYLACSVGCVYALRLRRWWVAGLCGMAAALTRQLGVVLLVPFVVEYLRRRDEAARPVGPWPLLAALLVPAGTLTYIGYLQLTLGNGLLFLRAQAAWQRSLAWPWQGALLSLQHILQAHSHKLALQTHNILDLSFLALFSLLIVLGIRLLPRSYTLYAAAVWLVVLLTPATGSRQPLALLSVSRFAVTLFPPFIVLALLTRRRGVDRLVLALSVALLTLFTLIYLRGRWIA